MEEVKSVSMDSVKFDILNKKNACDECVASSNGKNTNEVEETKELDDLEHDLLRKYRDI